MTDDLAFLDATAQADLVRSREASPLDLVDAAITRIEKLNPTLNAVVHPLFESARAAARGTLPDGPFRGVPTVVKDLDGILAGAPYHAGNKLLAEIDYVPDTTSHLFEKLLGAGFVVVAKTNTPELGLMPTTEPLAKGATRNPWNTDRATGGSSGGTAAAVASGMIPVGHGGDGGGSIRIPSSHCGLFGLKPSRGRVSLGPEEGEAWSGLVMRHVLARTVRDSAAILDVISGPMPGDPYTAPPPSRPYLHEVGTDPGHLRVGLRTHTPGGLTETDPECVAAAEDAARLLESLGHTVEIASPSALDDPAFMDSFMTIVISAVRAELDEIALLAGREVGPVDVEPTTWMYASMGAEVSGAQHVAAIHAAQVWSRKVVSWWANDGFDLLLTPTCAEPPPVLGDLVSPTDNPLHGALRAAPFVAYMSPFNVTGQPAMSVPLHISPSGLPIGAHLVAAPYREDLLLRVAAQLEEARPWAGHRPTVHA